MSEEIKQALRWWESLSINEMKQLAGKYFGKTFTWNGAQARIWSWIDVDRRPRWINEIYQKEQQ